MKAALDVALYLASLVSLVCVVCLIFMAHPEVGMAILVYFTVEAARMLASH